MAKTYGIYALHERSDLVEKCAKLLNTEWQRNHETRVMKLNRSNDGFPYNIAMLETAEGCENLVGHLRLTKVLGEPSSLYVSSVIIEKSVRGKGLGRKILKLTEDLMKSRGFDYFYLRTDSTEFYIKCGYELCDPVQEVLSNAMESKINELQNAMRGDSMYASGCDSTQVDPEESNSLEEERPDCEIEAVMPPVKIPTPPSPPPLPPPSCSSSKASPYDLNLDDDHTCNCNYWLRKHLSN